MLVLRYFMYVGGSLLALLLLCAALLPKPPVADTVASASNVPAIRIHSQQKWPERVVLDTNAPMPAPAKVAQTAVAPAEPQPKTGVLQAFAQLSNGEAKQQAVTDVKKPDPKPPVRRKIARRQAPQPPYPQGYYGYQGYGYPQQYSQRRMQVAQQPRFGFFW